MVIWTYSQKWAKQNYDARIKRLWNKVVTRPTPDLWIKVFLYRDKTHFLRINQESVKEREKTHVFFEQLDDVRIMHIYHATMARGHYRCAMTYGHGFYDTEWQFIRKHPKIRHCVTLKFGESCSDSRIITLQAHEYRHYLQWKKYGVSTMARKINGRRSRPIQIEKDANKWAKQRVEKLGYRYW